jgi:uncharacterized protein YdcH (DUF465 family)
MSKVDFGVRPDLSGEQENVISELDRILADIEFRYENITDKSNLKAKYNLLIESFNKVSADIQNAIQEGEALPAGKIEDLKKQALEFIFELASLEGQNAIQ